MGDDLVAQVCAAAVAVVHVDGAAVSMMVSPTVRDALHATDRVSGELEEWQLAFGEGPCVDAFAGGGPVLVADLSSDGCSARWPAFTPAALGSGARAVFTLPLQVGAIRLGVLDLYRTRPGRLIPQELADALGFADTAALVLVDGAAGTDQATAGLGWQRDDPAIRQAEVHQATGMVLAQLGTSAESAFARLRAHAYARDRQLREVAREVVDRRLRFEPDPPPDDHDQE
ncbi:MAG TPA: GAF and ANTAR domain-containing protein [Mycobacteriales bacterium]|nr:GAF and ANTAR domain-containing protein [Mycobacteriales bacterium]